MKNLLILDNNGKTFDRYTIINTKDGEMIGASEMPFNPLGFGQHCGNVADNYWNTAYGYQWRKGCNEKLISKRIKFAINEFKKDCSHVGKEIKFSDLPAAVQQFAKQSFED